MKKYKLLCSVLAIILVASVFAACGKTGNPAPSADKNSTQEVVVGDGELTYKGKITMFAQAYHPVEPTEANPKPPTEFKTIADEYHVLHPDIEIEFITSVPGDDYITWLKTKLSAGMSPDIVWAQNGDITGGTYPKGSMTNLRPYLTDRANPYVDGNAAWGDLFEENLQAQLYDTNGELWQCNADYVATAVIANSKMFEAAGVTEIPSTWTEFMDASEKLLAAGFTPWAFPFGNDADSMDHITWMSRLFYTNYYSEDFEKMAVLGGEMALSPVEVAIAFKNGDYDVHDPKYLHFWEFLKDNTKYMPADYLSPAIDTKSVLSMFLNENIAMYFDGNWATLDLELANPDFDYVMFPFPYPEKSTDEFATSFNSAASIGGPSAAWQYVIPSQKGNSTLSDEKLNACLDWLMFITTPENNTRIVNERGTFIPTIKGASALPGSESILQSLSNKSLVMEGGTQVFGSSFLDAYYRAFQEYLGGSITLEQAADRLAPIVQEASDKIIAEYGEDVSEFIK